MPGATQGNKDTAVFYGPSGEADETVLRCASQPKPKVQVRSGASAGRFLVRALR
jgi:hypothetical protein